MNNNSIRGSIKINKNTRGHEQALRAMGYKVENQGQVIQVEGTEFLASLDLSENPGQKLREVKDARQLLTYATKVTFLTEHGEYKTMSSVPMCLALGALCKRIGVPFNLSCLVVRPEGGSAGKVAAASSEAQEDGEKTVAEGWESFF